MNIISRRRFLQTTAIATASGTRVALGEATRKTSPNERLNMGVIGIGGMGRHDLAHFMTHDDLQVTTICEVDAQRMRTARRQVNAHYENEDCQTHTDWRELIARDDLDVILIATPDHWHSILALEAAKAGKDVYCEKPISLTHQEGRYLSDAIKKLGTVYQSGTQRRSIKGFAFAVNVVRKGLIGNVHTVHTGLSKGQQCPPLPDMPIPKGFDYDMWLGPAPDAPFTSKRCHGSFRWIFDYSGGQMTDIGAHFNDLAQWGLDREHTGPVSYEGHATFPKEGLFNTPVDFSMEATYADGVKLIMHDTDPRMVRFEGDEGWISVNDNGEVDAEPKSLLKEGNYIKQDYSFMFGHHRNFLDCVHSRELPIANAEVAHRSTTLCHIANIGFRLDRGLQWDPDKEIFVDDDEANAMLQRPKRAPWKLAL